MSQAEIPSKMRGILVEDYGVPKDVLKIKDDLDVPSLRRSGDEHEEFVLIKVHYSSINPVDYKIVRGEARKLFPHDLPFIPGIDVAGTVVKITDGCRKLKVGDKVWADAGPSRMGAFSEYVKLPESIVGVMPKSFNFEQAAATPLAGLTALQGLKAHAKLESGHKVLLLGGCGGVGSFSIQLAKGLGASYVSTTCGTGNFDTVKKLGADEFIDYTKDDWSEILKGKDFDIVFDCVGEKDAWTRAQKVLKSDGVFVTTNIERTQDSGKMKNISMITVPNAGDLDMLSNLAEKKVFVPLISMVHKFDDVFTMFDHCESGHTSGKMVFEIRK